MAAQQPRPIDHGIGKKSQIARFHVFYNQFAANRAIFLHIMITF
jgi:hypothetical protein